MDSMDSMVLVCHVRRTPRVNVRTSFFRQYFTEIYEWSCKSEWSYLIRSSVAEVARCADVH